VVVTSLDPGALRSHAFAVSRAARFAVFLLGLAVVAGCHRRPPPEEVVDGWALARKALTNGHECFASRADYCITDPAFVDGAIQPRLDELYGGEMPLRKVYADAVVREAVSQYRRALMKPPAIARVEELVRERYDNPKVSQEGDEVVIDMGVVPGKIVPSPATLSLRLLSSDLVENGSWKESEARRALASFAKKYPDKARVRVRVTIMTPRGMVPETFRYLRGDHRVVVELDGAARTTKPLDGGDEALATAPLALEGLEPCKGPSSPPDAFACPLLPKEPEAED
jgi:hypothetical protein